jgi:hypothetical protein
MRDNYLLYMYLTKRRFLILGTVIISICCILTFTHTNTGVKEKYDVFGGTIDDRIAMIRKIVLSQNLRLLKIT